VVGGRPAGYGAVQVTPGGSFTQSDVPGQYAPQRKPFALPTRCVTSRGRDQPMARS